MEKPTSAGLAADRIRESAVLDELSLSSIPSHLRGPLENSWAPQLENSGAPQLEHSWAARAPTPAFAAEAPGQGRLSRTSSYLSAPGEDDREQTEALRTIQELCINRGEAAHAGRRLSETAQDLDVERSARKRAETELMHTTTQLRQAQEQVLCLEHELDGKENALVSAEQRLEVSEQSLREAQQEIARLRGLQQPSPLNGLALHRHELAQSQKLLLEATEFSRSQKHLLETNEQEMARLVAQSPVTRWLAQLDKHVREDDAATSYGSDLSSARVSSHGSYR